MSTIKARPTSIRIFLADGIPDGIRVIEKSNWTGIAIVAGRSQLADALARDEMSRPGVYVLTGTGDDGASRLYIGEADVLRDRLKQHRSKDFWTTVVAFTSTNEGLNKAHVRYLESRLVGMAKAANQWGLENNVMPAEPSLSEADRADAEWFLEEMLLIYPVLGIDAFESASEEPSVAAVSDLLLLNERGAEGKGRETPDGFVVLQGSRARADVTSSFPAYLQELQGQLISRGVLERNDSHLVFTQDYRFTSPSTAAGIMVGASANGRVAWKDANGRTLKSLQDARAEGK